MKPEHELEIAKLRDTYEELFTELRDGDVSAEVAEVLCNIADSKGGLLRLEIEAEQGKLAEESEVMPWSTAERQVPKG